VQELDKFNASDNDIGGKACILLLQEFILRTSFSTVQISTIIGSSAKVAGKPGLFRSALFDLLNVVHARKAADFEISRCAFGEFLVFAWVDLSTVLARSSY
jgi:hypothetical protein